MEFHPLTWNKRTQDEQYQGKTTKDLFWGYRSHSVIMWRCYIYRTWCFLLLNFAESSTLFGGNKTGWKAPRVQSASTMVLCQAGNASVKRMRNLRNPLRFSHTNLNSCGNKTTENLKSKQEKQRFWDVLRLLIFMMAPACWFNTFSLSVQSPQTPTHKANYTPSICAQLVRSRPKKKSSRLHP